MATGAEERQLEEGMNCRHPRLTLVCTLAFDIVGILLAYEAGGCIPSQQIVFSCSQTLD